LADWWWVVAGLIDVIWGEIEVESKHYYMYSLLKNNLQQSFSSLLLEKDY
jgi:hypothetical protein